MISQGRGEEIVDAGWIPLIKGAVEYIFNVNEEGVLFAMFLILPQSLL
jgi:hypothetical protein